MKKDCEAYLRERLSKGVRKADIDGTANLVQCAGGDAPKEALYRLMFDPDRRVANNAAWVFCSFSPCHNEWLYPKQGGLMDEAMRTTDATKLRLMLVLLLRQPFGKENLRADFLDFCLGCIAPNGKSTSVTTLAIKLAYAQCKPFPDLLRELKYTLELSDPDMLSTGVRTVRRKTLMAIDDALHGGGSPES